MQFTVDKCESKRRQLTKEKAAMIEGSKKIKMIRHDRPIPVTGVEPRELIWWDVKDILKEDLLDQFPDCKENLVAWLRQAADEIEQGDFTN
jgi:hypothetical protein